MSSKKAKLPFSSLSLSQDILEVLSELEFHETTQIQAEAIPLLLSGRDVVGQSETGSGKTAAFAIPVLEKLDLHRRSLQALVICPTRELCSQVARQIRILGRRQKDLQVLTLTGGQRIAPQIFSLEKGVHIAVGTPGRIVDHLTRRSLDLSTLKILVLDEADRMLDMGFEEDMKKIVSATPKKRQTALFSATLADRLDVLVNQILVRPAFIKINAGGRPPEITEKFYATTEEEKSKALLQLLGETQPESAIVFCNLKTTVKDLTALLRNHRMSVACLHGDLEQFDRDRELAKFRNKSTRVLIATDVAARGIDVQDLDLVVNFDIPHKPETYIHRIGRTARAGKSGMAVSLATTRERFRVSEIEPLTGKSYEFDTLDLQGSSGSRQLPSRMRTLYISGGRKNKIRPTDLLGALTGEAGRLEGAQVGKIDISDHFSYVAIESAVAKTALERLQKGKIKGRKYNVEFAR